MCSLQKKYRLDSPKLDPSLAHIYEPVSPNKQCLRFPFRSSRAGQRPFRSSCSMQREKVMNISLTSNSGYVLLTLNEGLLEVPDSVPHADGVKLWEPTYSQPTRLLSVSLSLSDFEWLYSLSVSSSSSSGIVLRPDPTNEDFGRKVARIICVAYKKINQFRSVSSDELWCALTRLLVYC